MELHLLLCTRITLTEITQDYTSQVTITAPEGKAIASIKIEATNDYHIIDNISASVTTSDPALVAAAQEANATLATEQATLAALQTTETTATQALNAAQETLSTAQAAESTAQAEVITATQEVETTTVVAKVESDQAAIAVADAQVTVSNAVIPVITATLETVKTVDITPTTITNTVIAIAETAIADANTAIDAAEAKKTIADGLQAAAGATTTVESATAVVADKTEVLAAAETAVDAQEVVVDAAQDVKDTAQTVVDAATSQGLQVTVYNVQGQNNAPLVNSGTPIISTSTDTNGINEQWGGGLVAGSQRTDDVVVKYEGTWTPTESGTQYWHTPADDGVKLFLDGEQVVFDWYDKGGGGSTVDVEAVAGTSKAFTLVVLRKRWWSVCSTSSLYRKWLGSNSWN
jgi:hypothetical protein